MAGHVSNNVLNTNTLGDCSYSSCEDFTKFCNKSFSVIHINCRSLKKNLPAIIQFLCSINYSPSVIALTETWLCEEDEFLTSLPNYTLISLPRKSRRGGGVGFYVLNDLVFVVKRGMSISNDILESITVDIVHTFSHILITCIYRPPSTNVDLFNIELDSLLNTVKGNRNIYVLLGDFNLNMLNVHTHTPTTAFYNLIVSHGLTPTITKPTRISEFSSTMIDNILINTVKYKCKATIICTDISDHYPIMLELADMKDFPLAPDYKLRTYDLSSLAKFSKSIEKINWLDFNSRCHKEKDTNLLYQDFIKIFKDNYNKSFPVKTIRRTKAQIQSPPWMTRQLIKCCKKKSTLMRLYKENQTTSAKEKFVSYRNVLKKLIKKAEKLYYSKKFDENLNNAQKTWQIINSILSSTKHTFKHVTLTDDSGNVYDDSHTAHKFNEYFSNVGFSLAAKVETSSHLPEYYLPKSPLTSAVFDYTYPEEIESIIHALKSSTAVGHDEIGIKIIKIVKNLISTPLSNLINNSFETGIFPDALKISKVIPIFKGGDSTLLSNYRPISILPAFSKVWEKVIVQRLESYCLKMGIPSKNQYGFQKKLSTYMAIANVAEEISKSIDNKTFSIGVFIDLAKAFDTVNHAILISKLSNYGVRGLPLSLLKNYLSNRMQFVSIKDAQSSTLPIECGVPQGSILGPLLFLIYIDDIISSSKLLKFVLFADDTNVFMSSPNFLSLVQSFNTELALLSDWFKANKLSLNLLKTTYLIFGNRKVHNRSNPSVCIMLDGVIINPVTSTKFLGVLIDSQLSWKPHINKLILKLNRNSAIISKIRYKIDANIALKLYDTLILTHISYCTIIWAAGVNSSKLSKIHRIQKKALRAVVLAPYKSSSRPIFIKLKRLTIFDIYKTQVGSFMFANLRGLTPNLLPNYFQTNIEFHSRSTKSSTYLHIPYARTNLRKSSLSVYAPTFWNTIPDHIKKSPSPNIFKYRIKHWLLHS